MENQDSKKEMSFLGHLEELRWRLMKSAIAVIVVAIGPCEDDGSSHKASIKEDEVCRG